MEWGITLVSSFTVLLIVGPLVLLAGGILALLILGHSLPVSPTVARTSFDCPFSKRRVTAEFLSWPGSDQPADVLSCTAFRDPHRIRCKKACLGLAETGWAPSPMVPRFALIAGGVTHRPPVAPPAPARAA